MLIDKMDLPDNVAAIEFDNIRITLNRERDEAIRDSYWNNKPITYFSEILISNKHVYPSKRLDVVTRNLNELRNGSNLDAIILIRKHEE